MTWSATGWGWWFQIAPVIMSCPVFENFDMNSAKNAENVTIFLCQIALGGHSGNPHFIVWDGNDEEE